MLQFCLQRGYSQRPILRYSGRFCLETSSIKHAPSLIHFKFCTFYPHIKLPLLKVLSLHTGTISVAICVFQWPAYHWNVCIFSFVFAGDTGPFWESKRPRVVGPPQSHPPAEGQAHAFAIMITQVTHSCTYTWIRSLVQAISSLPS